MGCCIFNVDDLCIPKWVVVSLAVDNLCIPKWVVVSLTVDDLCIPKWIVVSLTVDDQRYNNPLRYTEIVYC